VTSSVWRRPKSVGEAKTSSLLLGSMGLVSLFLRRNGAICKIVMHSIYMYMLVAGPASVCVCGACWGLWGGSAVGLRLAQTPGHHHIAPYTRGKG